MLLAVGVTVGMTGIVHSTLAGMKAAPETPYFQRGASSLPRNNLYPYLLSSLLTE